MSSDSPDDDALTWAGDTEPAEQVSRPAGSAPSSESAVSDGWRVVGKPGRVATAPQDQRSGQMSSVALVTHGILAGVYLLYTIGWLIAAQRATGAPADIVGSLMFTVGLWLAVLAPALWTAATLWLTRGAPSLRGRMIALVIGALVLAPWPFIVGAS